VTVADYIIDLSGKSIRVARYLRDKHDFQILDRFPSLVGYEKKGEDFYEVVGSASDKLEDRDRAYISLFDNLVRYASSFDETGGNKEIIPRLISLLLNKVRKKIPSGLNQKDSVVVVLPLNASAEVAAEMRKSLRHSDYPNLVIVNDLESTFSYCYHKAINRIELKDWIQHKKEIKIYFFDFIKNDLNYYVACCSMKNGQPSVVIEKTRVLPAFSSSPNEATIGGRWDDDVMAGLAEDLDQVLFVFFKRYLDQPSLDSKSYILGRLAKFAEPLVGQRIREIKLPDNHQVESIDLYGAMSRREFAVNFQYDMCLGLRTDGDFFREIVPKRVPVFPNLYRKAFKLDARQTSVNVDFFVGTGNALEDGWLLKRVNLNFGKLGLMVSEVRQLELVASICVESQTSGKVWIENINPDVKNGEIRRVSDEISFELPFSLYSRGE
jgi:hypothetical protein